MTSRLTLPERKALAGLMGLSALTLHSQISHPLYGAETMLDVTLLMGLLGLTYEDFEALVAIGMELTATPCLCYECIGNE